MDPPSSNLPFRQRSHGRTASSDDRRRVAMPRRSTRGPLDAGVDPLSDPLSVPEPASPQRLPSSSPALPTVTSPGLSSPLTMESSSAIDDVPLKDFSYLLSPENFHPLPTTTILPPFLNSPHTPSPDAPLEDLLVHGHYRTAADHCARQLTTATSPTDAPRLFALLYTRLACLTLIGQHSLAAQEAKALGDLGASFYRHPLTGTHLVPWELRVLAVRLLALGGEVLRAGQEGRAGDEKMWEQRLGECGILVGNALVEMGELEGAGRHFAELRRAEKGRNEREERRLRSMEALVWLRVGDIQAARRACAGLDEDGDGVLEALIQMADGDYEGAVEAWQGLCDADPEDALARQNLAICLFYTGRIGESRELLESLTESGSAFHALTFNLSTVYDLCTERSRDRKMELAERLAARPPAADVWEKAAADFKL
ncbi:hypothetical protein H2199_000394 [Coniosporium tulheliwenetii]|uniref:Uncharacterized protein n=1 Tax=Coniosporium tulheliwenetii TaxID=3383036 RepID=A0ACC2ZPU6_9PEZI|nr:hypothetical protein H2199_000394 [Cladosporium sp. JES 115]